jgi:hypothetical protein
LNKKKGGEHGIVLGGGFEYALSEKLHMKAEYLHTAYGEGEEESLSGKALHERRSYQLQMGISYGF